MGHREVFPKVVSMKLELEPQTCHPVRWGHHGDGYNHNNPKAFGLGSGWRGQSGCSIISQGDGSKHWFGEWQGCEGKQARTAMCNSSMTSSTPGPEAPFPHRECHLGNLHWGQGCPSAVNNDHDILLRSWLSPGFIILKTNMLETKTMNMLSEFQNN